jgi:flagellar biosynthesis protein FliQ
MGPEYIVEMMQDAFHVALMLSLPVMIVTLVVGVAISIVQSITSIQEQTMVFVPKMVAVFIVLIITFTWMVGTVMDYTTELFGNIPNMVR